jgi:hypothetical protein
MENKMRAARNLLALSIGCLATVCFPLAARGAESGNPETGQLSLRKSVAEREYKGKTVEGEERRVAPGDSLWRILIQEKGLSSQRFSEYIVVIRGLNPGLGPNGALRIGETLFIPLRPDEVLQIQSAPKEARAAVSQPGKGAVQEYQIRQGDHLYQILRERLGITDERRLAMYYALVKDLNPQKKNWDVLIEGETIRLPVLGNPAEARSVANRPAAQSNTGAGRPGGSAESTQSSSGTGTPAAPTAPPAAPAQSAARENLALVARVIESLGNEFQTQGEAVLPVKEGAVRLENSSYPVVYNRSLNQKVILDVDGNMPPPLRSTLSEEQDGTSVLSLSRTVSVHDAVSQLLSRLGYQALSPEQPIVMQQGGLAVEARGEWTVLAPQQSNKRQEIFIINISDRSDGIPDYLRAQLARSGVQFKTVSWLSSAPQKTPGAAPQVKETLAQSKVWPRDKRDIVDAVLFAYGVPFGVSETVPLELHPGIKLEMICDRMFEMRGQRTALFFRHITPEVKEALQTKLAVKVLELETAKLSSRELIGKLLSEMGEPAAYKEHRFGAVTGAKRDQLTISAWGFLISKPAMFLTDRQIPKGYERFFFEKGLDIVYFQ